MTIEELKAELQNMELPTENFKMSEWETVINVKNFLYTHFRGCEQAGDRYAETSDWERLLRFYEAVKAIY